MPTEELAIRDEALDRKVSQAQKEYRLLTFLAAAAGLLAMIGCMHLMH